MKVVKVTKIYFELEDGSQVEHAIPLINVPTVEEFQKMYDKAEKLIKSQQEDSDE